MVQLIECVMGLTPFRVIVRKPAFQVRLRLMELAQKERGSSQRDMSVLEQHRVLCVLSQLEQRLP
ncbi:hypothetical protein D9M70_153790 [compost metagenome]